MPLQSRYVDNLITSSPEKFTKTSISSSSTGRDVFGRLLEGFSPKRLKFIGSYTKHKNHNWHFIELLLCIGNFTHKYHFILAFASWASMIISFSFHTRQLSNLSKFPQPERSSAWHKCGHSGSRACIPNQPRSPSIPRSQHLLCVKQNAKMIFKNQKREPLCGVLVNLSTEKAYVVQ